MDKRQTPNESDACYISGRYLKAALLIPKNKIEAKLILGQELIGGRNDAVDFKDLQRAVILQILGGSERGMKSLLP
jgi:hypothetical protein